VAERVKHLRPAALDALISANMEVSGGLTFHGGLRVDGRVRGDVLQRPGSGSVLVLGEGGEIDGSVEVREALIAGVVTGDHIHAQVLTLYPGAHVRADIHYQVLAVHHGAIIEGRLVPDGGTPLLTMQPAPALLPKPQ
jgi:cytoskeletal protein CcmA (bactofilin family)